MRTLLFGLVFLVALVEGVVLQVVHQEVVIIYQAGLSSQRVPSLTALALRIAGYPEPSGTMAFVFIQVLPVIVWTGLLAGGYRKAWTSECLLSLFAFNWLTFLSSGFALLLGLRTLNLPVLIERTSSSVPLLIVAIAVGYLALMFVKGSRKKGPGVK